MRNAYAEHTRKRFYRMLSIRGTDFIACWAYEERNSAHAQPAVKCEQFYMYNTCSAYAERILSHTEHTRKCLKVEYRLNRIWFSKILCYRPLGPYGFGFCKKIIKKIFSCLCTFKQFIPDRWVLLHLDRLTLCRVRLGRSVEAQPDIYYSDYTGIHR